MPTPGFSETNALVAVLERKSFSKAAKQLGLSPARVSELVRNLEERLGVRLVERTTRSVAATAAGERLLARLRPLLDEYQAAIDSLNDFRSEQVGTLRLAVAPAAADFILAPHIARFASQYPRISLDISVDRAFVDIVAAGFDAGIRPGGRIARDMIAVRVSDAIPLVVAASPAYLEQHGRPNTPGELTRHACIRNRLPTGSLPWRFGRHGRVLDVQVDGPLTADDARVTVGAAVDGVGLIQAPLALLASEIAAGRLIRVLADWTAPPPVDGLFLYYPSRRHIRPQLKVLVDFLRDAYRNISKEQLSVPNAASP
jgi:DNA-binding transcriptional LysR family regulator